MIRFSVKPSRHQYHDLNDPSDRTKRKVQLKAQAKGANVGQSSLLLFFYFSSSATEMLAGIPQSASVKHLVFTSDSNKTSIASYLIRSATFKDGFKTKPIPIARLETLLDFDFSLDIPKFPIRDVFG